MKLANLSNSIATKRLKKGINIEIGPFCFNVKTSISSVISNIQNLYSEHTVLDDSEFIDFFVNIDPPHNIRRWVRPQALFTIDDHHPIEPLPLKHAYPLFEWGLNWCIANRAHQYLIFHAALVEKNGKAILMPGDPGVGKSTLCTALTQNGWSLMSDELALISLQDHKAHPIPKPISLKNRSIEIISDLYPQSTFGKIFYNTSKGTLSHLKAPVNSKSRADIRWIIFPKYQENAKTQFTDKDKGESYISLLKNAFNHNVFGKKGFDSINHILENCDTMRLSYSEIPDAIYKINQLTSDADKI